MGHVANQSHQVQDINMYSLAIVKTSHIDQPNLVSLLFGSGYPLGVGVE
jgi:hypothetical protein